MKRFKIIRTIISYADLLTEVDDYARIHETIEKDLIFKGTNLWILVSAVFVASVGLNMNSTAVIIGAMLISPLMGPINGMGYSLATYNFQLFRKAVKNFCFAVVSSLIASTLYFSISPISVAHSELLARTSPTIYDVLIAFFGGMAGIIAISSKQKGNVIPGVAIATALMPPLCTAGYGLATGQFSYFFGAGYLFTINTVFIAISAVVFSRILKIPISTIVEPGQRKRINRWITFVIVLVLIPSIYFGYQLVQKEKFVDNASRFVKNISVVEGNYLLKNEISPKDRSIKLVYAGSSMTESQKRNITAKAAEFSLDPARIEFRQGLSFDEINSKSSEIESLKSEINRLVIEQSEDKKLADSLLKRSDFGRQVLLELRSFYPQLITCSFADSYEFKDSISPPERNEIVVLATSRSNLTNVEKGKIEKWLKTRINSDKVKIYYESSQ